MDTQGQAMNSPVLALGVSILPLAEFQDINSDINKPLYGKRKGALCFAELGNGGITPLVSAGGYERSPWRQVNVQDVMIEPTGNLVVASTTAVPTMPKAHNKPVPSTILAPVCDVADLSDINSAINRTPLSTSKLILCFTDTNELYYAKGDNPADPWICFNGVAASAITPTGTLTQQWKTQTPPNALIEAVTFSTIGDLSNQNSLINDNRHSGKQRGSFIIFPIYDANTNAITAVNMAVASGSAKTSSWWIIGSNINTSVDPTGTNLFQYYSPSNGAFLSRVGDHYRIDVPENSYGGMRLNNLHVKAGQTVTVSAVKVAATGYQNANWVIRIWDGQITDSQFNGEPNGTTVTASKVINSDRTVTITFQQTVPNDAFLEIKDIMLTLEDPA